VAASRSASRFADALARELMERRIEVLGEPKLHGVFFNSYASRRDHVAVYVVSIFGRIVAGPNREIIECGSSKRRAAQVRPRARDCGSPKCSKNKQPIATWR